MHKVETLTFGGATKTLILAAGGVIGGGIIVMGSFSEDLLLTIITGLAVMGICCAVVLLPRLEISTDGRQLVLDLHPLKRYAFPLAEVEDVRPVSVNAASYGGIGLRFAPGTTGLIMHSGQGIEFTHHSRRYVFSSKDPDKVLRVLALGR